MSRQDRPTIGATTGSTPLPSPPSTVYKPAVDPRVAVEVGTSRKLSEYSNKLDNLKLRCDLLDGTLIPLLKMLIQEVVTDNKEAKADLADLLKWFEAHKQQLAEQYSKIATTR
ncbi:MAG TPA: hypothetical protein VFS97_04140 [Nitrososphaeraceae archaeon]|nr:hypothetical protein [Nitrososphaeraceae archaeon]